MSPACRGSMVVIPPFGGGCAGHCAQTADHLDEKCRKWGVVGEVDYALSRWALTWRLRGRGPNVNVVCKLPTCAPRLVGGITTIEGLCRRVAGVSGVYGSNSPVWRWVRRTLCSNCRPSRRKMPKMGCCGRGGLRFEQMGSDMAPPRRCAVPGDGPHPRIFAGASDTSRELPLAQGGGITKPPGARPGGKWSGRRESNPPLKLGKLPFYR